MPITYSYWTTGGVNKGTHQGNPIHMPVCPGSGFSNDSLIAYMGSPDTTIVVFWTAYARPWASVLSAILNMLSLRRSTASASSRVAQLTTIGRSFLYLPKAVDGGL